MPWGGSMHAMRAEKNDPLSPRLQFNLGWLLISAGRYDEAARYCNKLPADQPNKNSCLGRALVGQGRTEEAIRIFIKSDNRPIRLIWATLMRGPVAARRLRSWQLIFRQGRFS